MTYLVLRSTSVPIADLFPFAQNEVAFPMTWNSAVVNRCWPFGNHHHGIAKTLAGNTLVAWLFHSTALAQTCGDFFLQLAFSLEEQRHIDSFRTHPHSVIVREV
ncbi:hypothetical protein I4J28_02565 [Corynebacterium belfantii]|nr:hypothetical protein [Corynebacterium belfantii]MBG9298086.1 hypothetical protein [Corynebacterium belfantii]MBG9306954.1 hypothetical protein [Corynebacterium belfantii]